MTSDSNGELELHPTADVVKFWPRNPKPPPELFNGNEYVKPIGK